MHPRRRIVVLALAGCMAVLATALPAFAQGDPDQPPPGGGYGGQGGRGARWGHGGRMAMFAALTPEVLDGPAPADSLRAVLTLTDSQAAAYAALRDSFMAATVLDRDDLHKELDAMRAARGDREAMDVHGDSLQRLAKQMKTSLAGFDENLRALFTKGQAKTYRKWTDERAKRAEEERRERMRERWRDRRPEGEEPEGGGPGGG